MVDKYQELIEHDCARGAHMWEELPYTTIDCKLLGNAWVVDVVLIQIKEM